MTAQFPPSALAGSESMPPVAAYGRVADIPVRLSVEAGTARLPLSALLALDEGAIVELDRLADDPLDILANGKLIARGEIVTIGDRLSIRVIQIVDGAGAWPEQERRR